MGSIFTLVTCDDCNVQTVMHMQTERKDRLLPPANAAIFCVLFMGAMPEMRYTANGAPVTNFSMATNRIWRGQDGESQKQTDWHRVTAWGRLAEVVNQYMGKGKRVRVIGRLEYQSWNDKTSGELRTRAVIVASQVLFLDYDRAHTGLAEESEAEEQPVEVVAQPHADAPARPKRSRRKQAA
jgi:single-strand DNA-binding protein